MYLYSCNFGGWQVENPQWWCPSLSPKVQKIVDVSVQRPSDRRILSYWGGAFCSIQASADWMRPTTCGGQSTQSTDLHVLCILKYSYRNTQNNVRSNTGHPVAQSRWPIKLTSTGILTILFSFKLHSHHPQFSRLFEANPRVYSINTENKNRYPGRRHCLLRITFLLLTTRCWVGP